MKSRLLPLLALSACAAVAAQAADQPAPEPKVEKRVRTVTVTASDDGEAKEKVTFLGVETGPVPRALAAHLGLDRDLGLVVNSVAKDSPAAGVLQENDVLKQLDDQILVDGRQLSVLIRAKKPGTEVKLTIVRAGKEQVVTAKLGEREVMRSNWLGLNQGDGGPQFRFFGSEGGPVIERLRELPGLARDEINDALRVIGKERPHWIGNPRVHVIKRSGDGGSTILNMAEGNFVFSDDAGSLEVNASKGERKLLMKDAAGKVTFEGPINTDEQRAALPPEVKERLKKLDTVQIEFNADETLRQEGATVKPVEKAQTRREIRVERRGGEAETKVVVGRPI